MTRVKAQPRATDADKALPPATYAIKAHIDDPHADVFVFPAQKTMYGGKAIDVGDPVFLFASENEGGTGLIARGIVESAGPVPRKRGVARQTPRVSVVIRRIAAAKQRLGRAELQKFDAWDDGRPATELNFKLYRQATNKIIGLSAGAAAFLERSF